MMCFCREGVRKTGVVPGRFYECRPGQTVTLSILLSRHKFSRMLEECRYTSGVPEEDGVARTEFLVSDHVNQTTHGSRRIDRVK